jgi:hypothetical protein
MLEKSAMFEVFGEYFQGRICILEIGRETFFHKV